jgi:hypothetical protein
MPRTRIEKSKRVKLVELIKQKVPYKTISEQEGVSIPYLHNLAHVLRKRAKEKRQQAKAIKDFSQLNDKQKDLMLKVNRNERERLQDRVDEQEIQIRNLQHREIGYRAVISYLEDLAQIRQSQ